MLGEPGPPGVGQLVALLVVGLADDGLHEALVLELGQGRVDGAGARPPAAARALLELTDELVAVHRPLGEQPQDGPPDRAAAGALAVAMATVVTAGVGHESHSSSHEGGAPSFVHGRSVYR